MISHNFNSLVLRPKFSRLKEEVIKLILRFVDMQSPPSEGGGRVIQEIKTNLDESEKAEGESGRITGREK